MPGTDSSSWCRSGEPIDRRPPPPYFLDQAPLDEFLQIPVARPRGYAQEIGVLAIRMKDQRLDWDGDTLKITNNEAANALVNPSFRDGWSL